MEELWWKGEAGLDLDSFSQSQLILEPDHFQCLFLIMGSLNSLGLIVLLWDILANPNFGFFTLMILGLSACLLITSANIFFFSTALWTPIAFDYGKGDISTGVYEINMEILVNNKGSVKKISVEKKSSSALLTNGKKFFAFLYVLDHLCRS